MNTSLLRRLTVTLAFVAVMSMIVSPTSAAPAADDDPGSAVRLSNAAIAHRLIDRVFNDEDFNDAALLVSDDAIIHTQLGDFTGPSGLLHYVDALKHTYPGATFSVLHATSSGDSLTLEWLLTSTKIRMAMTGDVASVDVHLRGTTAITTQEGQIAGMTFDRGVAVQPNTVAYERTHSQPY